jgi:benzoyl-CoA reductase/2-hydroxyglutaryl-CoA dehydratase subunit BcrC/BadD/HgdB
MAKIMRRLAGLMDQAEDEPLEFDQRYLSKSKVAERKRQHGSARLFTHWMAENSKVIDRLRSQKQRAASMEYFDSVFTTDARLKELKALRKRGKKIIGTFCNVVPEELIYAAGAVPLRLCSGHHEAIRPAEECFPRDSCPLIKASFGNVIASEPYVSMCDAVVLPATCDGKKKLGEVLNDYLKVWVLDLPQDKERTVSKKYWYGEARILKKRLERLTRNKVTRKGLKSAIKKLQSRQKIVERLMNLRKSHNPVISGRDALLVAQASFFDSIDRWMEKTAMLCEELEGLKPEDSSLVRVLITGAPVIMPNFKIPNLIEDLGACIVTDQTCSGSQSYYDEVVVDEWTMQDMMHAVSERYLMPSSCPCFIKAEDRIDKLKDMLKEYRIDGVVYHTLRLCLLFDVESNRIKDVMEDEGVPFLHINTDYSREDREQLRTRIEAFVEILRSRKRK